MRVLSQLPVVQDSNPNFLHGAIQNETDTQDGTPVVRELYNDPIQNLYKLLDLTGLTPTGTEDSEASQYQIVEAIRKLPNLMNDVEQILNLTGLVWSANFNLDLLPNKYFFFARASENYVNGSSYTFKGTGATEYNFTSAGFTASDELLVIIDSGTVRAYSLTSISATSTDVFTVLGQPLAYNDTNVMRYQEGGNILSDLPSVSYLENLIRIDSGDGSLILNDIFVTQGYVLCFCYSVDNAEYLFYHFSLSDIGTAIFVNSNNIFGTSDDFMPYVFVGNDDYIYSTNNANNDAEDYLFTKMAYDPLNSEITLVSNFPLENTFIKTSNAVVYNDKIFTFISGNLDEFSLFTGIKKELGIYNGVGGQIFGFDGGIYFTSGEVAKKWTL